MMFLLWYEHTASAETHKIKRWFKVKASAVRWLRRMFNRVWTELLSPATLYLFIYLELPNVLILHVTAAWGLSASARMSPTPAGVQRPDYPSVWGSPFDGLLLSYSCLWRADCWRTLQNNKWGWDWLNQDCSQFLAENLSIFFPLLCSVFKSPLILWDKRETRPSKFSDKSQAKKCDMFDLITLYFLLNMNNNVNSVATAQPHNHSPPNGLIAPPTVATLRDSLEVFHELQSRFISYAFLPYAVVMTT